MENWHANDPLDTDWDEAVTEYARLFQTGQMDGEYRGVCVSRNLGYTLRFCADLVIRNLAPESWLFTNTGSSVSLYFHNTSSLGIYVPDSYDPGGLIQRLETRGLSHIAPE